MEQHTSHNVDAITGMDISVHALISPTGVEYMRHTQIQEALERHVQQQKKKQKKILIRIQWKQHGICVQQIT